MARAFPPLYSHKFKKKNFLTDTAGGRAPPSPPPPLESATDNNPRIM